MASYFPGVVVFFSQLITNLLTYKSLLIFLVIWTIFWRGFAMWKAARNRQYFWFAAIYILESLGILPMIYLWFFARKRKI